MSGQPASWSIADLYVDAFGHARKPEPAALDALRTALVARAPRPDRPSAVISIYDTQRQIVMPGRDHPSNWRIGRNSETVLAGTAAAGRIELPHALDTGSYDLTIEDGETFLLLVAPALAYQPPPYADGGRGWLIAAQLYAIRSKTNWGHGDFGDLDRLLDLAATLGAAGIGVNPLHALGEGEASPYSPSSRIFLNPLYIEIDRLPEFSGAAARNLSGRIAALRDAALLDYTEVAHLKSQALHVAYGNFETAGDAARRDDFRQFRRERGERLEYFAAFQVLLVRLNRDWREWPQRWRRPSRELLDELYRDSAGDMEFHAYVQWVADRQLRDCCRRAQSHGLAIGLYLDVAVGLAKAGADAWACQDELATGLSVGAPPDLYNRAGQDWGITTFHPQVLIESDFALFRLTMREVMRHAGAIRLDHVLGLNRLYLIPDGFRTAEGAYVHFPFDAMLAVAAQESVAQRCLIVGEDLGTVPEGVSEKLGAHGIWSYRVALFETEHDGRFKSPDLYPVRALVTFTTHDLPTLRGWIESHDINTKRDLGIEVVEDESGRTASAQHLSEATAGAREQPVTYTAVARFLARTPSKMVSISLEDVFDIVPQPNLPGTISEYPNWRQRLPVDLEDFETNRSLRDIADIMAAEGRSHSNAVAQ